MPCVFIIIVNYNGSKDTLACLDSIKNITYKNYKVIVVDNGSSEDKNILSDTISDENIQLILLNKNIGFSAGNNVGIRYALNQGADYIVLLNNDTVVEPDFLTNAICRMQKNNNEKIGILIGKIFYFSSPHKVWYAGGEVTKLLSRVLHYDTDDDSISTEERYVNYATGCYYCIPSSVIKIAGELPEEYFLYCEDTDYSTAVINNGYRILYYPQSVIYHKVNGSTGSNSDLYKYYTTRNKFYYIKKYRSGIPLVLSMAYQIARTIRNYLFRGHSIAYLWGMMDYYKNRMGKSNRVFASSRNHL